MLRPAPALWAAFALTLSACQTAPRETVLNLDTTDPRWTSPDCVAARKAVHGYNDKGLMRSAAGIAGTAAAGPVVGAATASALSVTQDDEREDLNNKVKRACVSSPEDRRAASATTTAMPSGPPPLAVPPPAAGEAGQPASTTEPAEPR